ncbi:MAG: DUF493 family protein [Nonlabens sp.]|uniref:DUF493 family protein n=1 Tax=Nonlabens sp. TaxID=1888209 RepID=UPI003EF48963
MDPKNSAEFYQKLKSQLEETSTWPSKYLYKFIVPSQPEKIHQITQIFDNIGAVIVNKESSKGTYTSVSITVVMKSPDAVIEKYKEVGAVEGVISL